MNWHATPPAAAPREIVLASAGSGKTFRISSRIIGLLAHGQPVESILASTFTRKAAGQILEAVLERMAKAALGPKAAAELAGHARLPDGPALPVDPTFWAERLAELVRGLHRAGVGTLDAFFVSVVRTFVHELGLSPEWGIGEEPLIRRMRSEALQDVLARADAGELAELLRLLNRGGVRRSVHDHLLGELDKLLAIHDELHPGVENPWAAFGDGEDQPLPSDAEREVLAQEFEALPVPVTQKNTPRQHWANSLETLPTLIRENAWEAFLGNGLCKKVIDGEETYDRAAISEEVCELVEEGRQLAARALRPALRNQIQALGRLTTDFAAAYRTRQAREGIYRFDDLTRMLAAADDPIGGRADLYYRLDARVRHLLLDEFQDTSLAQWEALAPLVEEVLSDPGNRAGVVVADPKQSIYGWRGGEPAIVHHVGERYRLDRHELAVSWRSAPVVLEMVNRVFERINESPTISADQVWAPAAQTWSRDFATHRAAEHNRELPGYVEVIVGPRDGRVKKAGPDLCRLAAKRVREVHDEAPWATIAVLTRTNDTVARMIYELKNLGLAASEEGGTALTDSAPCEAVLALLHLADHPGDTIARYHVARSPLGDALAFTDPDDGAGARRLARRVRAVLAENGYGPTIDGWAGEMASSCDARELRRLAQLAEIAHRYDDRASLRPSDFVRLVEAQRVEDPTTAPIRVMTVHQAKGLQFDVVVLPELDGSIGSVGRVPALPFRPDPVERITAVYPHVSATLRPLFPEIQAAYEQACAARLRDDLSALYVALTRAKHAVHVILRADGSKPGETKSPARILRELLPENPDPKAVIGEGEVLYEAGHPDWYRRLPAGDGTPTLPAREIPAESIRLAAPPARRRLLPRRSPSSLEGGDALTARDILRLDSHGAFERGSIVHAWCELIEWLDDGPPDEADLRAVARELAPDFPAAQLDELLASFDRSLRNEAVRQLLSRSSYPDGAEVHREATFVHRESGILVEGSIDRLVLVRDNGRPARADIIDFKTDNVTDEDSLPRRIAFYRPQMRAYWHAVQALYRLSPEAVTVKMVFMQRGMVVRIAVDES